ncbi:MAG: ABC transporter substrate-binding protein [Burkholderiales bacterium]
MRAAPWALALALVAAPALGQPAPIVAGAVIPETGLFADFGAGMKRALEQWRDECNAAGGLLGRPLELRLLDDHSEATASLQLYAQLIEQAHAELLLGPFGSAATVAASSVTERAGRVLVNATGAARNIQRAGRQFVVSVPAPYAAYGTGPLSVAHAAGYVRLQIVRRADPASREAAEALAALARAAGLEVALDTALGGAKDVAARISAARARNAQAWIGFGGVEDAAQTIRTFKRLAYAPWMLLVEGMADPRIFADVGQDAEFALGLTTYDPVDPSPANAAFLAGWRRHGPGEPGAAAAAAYSAARVLEAGVRAAGSLEPARLRSALGALQLATPIGRFAVDADGVQTGVKPVVVQILRGRREIVWPSERATAKWRLPYPRWDERRVHATP